ncbi:FIST signal transduction protein [Inhella crocodyli]|uniref:Histidine kinase n=1 Tax=Inhella crocodyli TaxID=2499851 RepID=A0A3S2UJL6_9BURK|nr:FIST N-terminal domain-containing protein [Inhella crocodyli]RVT87629.1 hypothetical protein EOD73_00955 [Inhella crocodyli]
MHVEQVVLRDTASAASALQALAQRPADWVLVFGAIAPLRALDGPLKEAFPNALRTGCSTAGEISNDGVSDGSCVVTAIRWEGTRAVEASTVLQGMDDSHAAGVRLGAQLPREGLRAVWVLGQGVAVNGSALIQGMAESLGPEVPITGGLAGDAAAFSETWVLSSEGVHNDRLVCVGLYGESLRFSHGSFGGWSPFGPARRVTRSENNVLFELDGEPALEVYKRYLGEHAKDLPASGLLFPFAMLGSDHNDIGLIRTILGVDEAAGSLTLAGEIDPDGYLKLMHANTNALVSGAEAAAQAALEMHRQGGAGSQTGLALLVSCVGRKLVMGGRVDEEVEAVADVFGQGAVITGFYSNGEISPFTGNLACKLHNQTMTITYLTEA